MSAIRQSSRPLKATAAFSLIEVVLALSIVAIGLLTILGLFPQALTSAKNAADDSICGMVAQDTIAARKIDIQTGIATIGVTPPTFRWFTGNGQETNAASASNAMFKCEITATAVPGFANLEATQLRIIWPWFALSTASKQPPNTNIFVTEIAKY
ncbi:MAG TPA: hypothetical protein VNL17_11910 [Verrucomicrobiae bacterium]|nr:hypothetical protein [Verrucomicrobiae bacterium]